MNSQISVANAGIRLCGCGCGEEVNPKLRQFLSLTDKGRSHQDIADAYGVTRSYVSLLIRKPPRYIKGHYRNPPTELRTCAHCRREFRTCSTTRRFCLASDCQLANMISDWQPDSQRRVWFFHEVAELQRRLERELVALRKARLRVVAELQRRLRRAIYLTRFVLNRAARETLRKARAWEWELDKAAARQLREVRAWEREQRHEKHRTEKLQRRIERETIAAERRQEASLQWGTVALDARLGDGDDTNSTWGEIIPDYRGDPLHEIQADRLWEIVGDMRPEDVAKLDDHALARLQARLRDEGFAPPMVAASERERLREPDIHSGGGISKSKSRGGKRRRKEQVALMSGKRPSYKQPKRWSRETIEDAA